MRSSARSASRPGRSSTPTQTNRVGLLVEVASMELFQEAMGSPTAAAAMIHDGVRPDSVQVFIER